MNHESDVHGLFNLSGPINRIKTIHKNVVSSYRLQDYFSHPLNLFHLTKRLLTMWKEIADLILESATCVKNMRVKLQNIVDNIPDEKQFNYIAYRISKLQIYQKLSPADIIKGTISGMQPEEQMNLTDAFDIGKAAFNNEDFYTAIDWLEYIDEQLIANKHQESDINRTTVLSKLSSAYFKNGWIDKALKVTAELLKIDPNNKMAKRNKSYFESVKNAVKPKPDKKPEPASRFDKLYRDVCSGDLKKNLSVSSRLTCTYLPWKNQTKYERPGIEVMVYNRNPLIVLFPNLLDDMVYGQGCIQGPDGQIQNIGMNGFKEKRVKFEKDRRGKPLGSIVGFGDVVFYEEGARMAVCPVMYGQQWYLTSSLIEYPRTAQSFLERRVPKL
ncbi:hypothetical protein KUTeg_001408 [Tegillarca granosa]|uniref:Tetratricopeptide repeat protein n=1 Tax=Tegillarca granosa TaxID=220873 RepID=A0ABQ9FRD1_TEGGR|nr:hypothetical protein KUTeg_001408 [Tegillarca granosa]